MATAGAAAAYVAIAATVVSTGVAVHSAQQQAAAAKGQAAYQAGVARNNKIIAERQAADARARGEEEARKTRVKAQAFAARQRTQFAGAGLVVGEGSALDLTADTIALGEADALTIRSNAEREALAFEARGAGFESQAVLFGLSGESAAAAGRFGVAGSLISGAGNVAGKWYQFNREGAI